MSRAFLHDANLRNTDLDDANLRGADLTLAIFDSVALKGTNFATAKMYRTKFVDTNLADATGLDQVTILGPSSIGVDTLVKSRGKIPDAFLQGCGFQAWQILDAKLYDPDLTAAEIADLQCEIFQARTSGPLLIGGVFISYGRTDAGFVDKIRSELMKKGVSVWLDRHDLLPGPLQKQIDRAVGLNNVVLLVLSKTSIESDWVEHEMSIAHEIERKTKRDVLCPVALDDAWKEKVKDVVWEHLKKKKYILDFSKWKTKAFAAQFDKLIKGLKIYYEKPEA